MSNYTHLTAGERDQIAALKAHSQRPGQKAQGVERSNGNWGNCWNGRRRRLWANLEAFSRFAKSGWTTIPKPWMLGCLKEGLCSPEMHLWLKGRVTMAAEWLTGPALSKRIRTVVGAPNVRCAVAFWGSDAVEELFGTEVLERNDVQIVCDLSMGATNPGTLEALGAPDNPRLRHMQGLHAKLYHSDAGMIVGSANASANGIGFMEEAAGLTEAAVFQEVDSAPWRAALKWFNGLAKDASPISAKALDYAEERWRLRSKAGRNAARRSKGQQISLLQALKDEPEIFEDIHFAFSDTPYLREDMDKADAVAREAGFEPDRKVYDYFDSLKRETEHWPLRFILIWRTRQGLIKAFLYTRGVTCGETHFPVKGRRRNQSKFESLLNAVNIPERVPAEFVEAVGEKRLDKAFENYRLMTAQQASKLLFGSKRGE